MSFPHSRRGIVPIAALAALLLLGSWLPGVGAQSATFSLNARVDPATVAASARVGYTVTVQNRSAAEIKGALLAHTLPGGFTYIPGTARLWANHTLVAQPEPSVSGSTLRWSGLPIPAGRAATAYGMHTFVQDRCNKDYIAYQLDRVRELMGPGAFVKQLLYRITTETGGPEGCWVEFVNGCYDRDLIPVVRLAGQYGGPNWLKPYAPTPGDYSQIAAAMARVVAGLPRRDGRRLYVEIWNEPNLNIEWGGRADPVEYAEFLVDVAAALRALGDGRIVLLNGGLSPGGDYDRLAFIDAMATVPGALHAFDVWASHPYPGNHPPEYNIHDDAASTYAELTIDSYLLELQRLAQHGRIGLSVLLTETGYALGQNNFGFQGYPAINEGNRADYIARAFRDHWTTWPEVLGVCPYELVDPYGSWGVWDWLYPSGARHQQYDAVRALDKTPSLAPGEWVLRFEARAGEVAGVHASRVELSYPGGGPIALDGAAPVRVLAPTPTPTAIPTLTATPISTPTPTATQTSAPTSPTTCGELVVNGGFETDEGWILLQTAYPAHYVASPRHDGERALQLGIPRASDNTYSYSSAEQVIALPAAPLELSFWYYPVSSDPLGDRQYLLLLDEQGGYEVLMWIVSDAQTWTLKTLDLSAYAGRRVRLRFGVFNDGEDGVTAMYVDGVSLWACDTPAPQPTPTQTPTPVQPQALAYVLQTVPVGRAPRGVAVDPTTGAAYVANYLGGDLTVLDASLQAVGSIALPGAAGCSGVALDVGRARAYVANGLSHDLSVVDLARGVWQANIPLGQEPLGVAVDERDGRVYVSEYGGGQLSVLDGKGLVALAPLQTGTQPAGVVVDAARERIAVANHHPLLNTVSLLAIPSGSALSTAAVGAEPFGLALDPASGRLYSANTTGRSVSVVGPDGAWQGDLPLPAPVHQVAYNPRSGHLFALCPETEVVYVLNPRTSRTLGSLPVGRGSGHGIALDVERQRVYITNSADDTVTVIQDVGGEYELSLPLVIKAGAYDVAQSGSAAVARQSAEGEMPPAEAGLRRAALPLFSATPEAVRDLALDAERGRLAVAAGRELVVLDAFSGRPLTARTLAGEIAALAWDGGSGLLCATLPDRGAMVVLDAEGAIAGDVTGLGRPTGVVAADGRAYVADSAGRRLVTLGLKDRAIMATQPLSEAPYALALDRAAGRLYAGLMGSGRVLALDAETLAPLAEVALGGLGYPLDLALDSAAHRLYVAHALSPKYGALTLIGTSDMTIRATLTGNLEEPLYGASAVCVDGARDAVVLGLYGRALRLDARTLAVQKEVPVGREVVHSLALSPEGDALWMGGEAGRLWAWRPESAIVDGSDERR